MAFASPDRVFLGEGELKCGDFRPLRQSALPMRQEEQVTRVTETFLPCEYTFVPSLKHAPPPAKPASQRPETGKCPASAIDAILLAASFTKVLASVTDA